MIPDLRGLTGPAMRAAWLLIGWLVASVAWGAAPPGLETAVNFDLPPGPAAQTLPRLSAQAGGLQILYRPEVVAGVSTHAVQGRFAPRAALERMLAGTPLAAVPDSASGAIAIVLAPAHRPAGAAKPPAPSQPPDSQTVNFPTDQRPSSRPASPLLLALSLIFGPSAAAQTSPNAANTPAPDPIILSPFNVDASRDRGYQAASTLAGTRIRTNLADIGSSVSVMTEEFLRDIGATDNESALMYALNTEVGGPRGNFSGGVSVSTQNTNELALFSNPSGNTRVRGLTNADNTRNYFLSDVPWDGYTVSRVDLQRGPNAILFGLGSPAGVVNATINVPEFRNRGSVGARLDQFGSRRFTLDYNRSFLNQQLAARVDVLHNEQKFRQDPAFSDDLRYAGALRYRPRVLNRDGMTFEIAGNYEKGSINSNRPRILPPLDQLSGWWAPVSQGGLAQQTFNPVLTRQLTDRNNAAFLPSLGGYRSASIVMDPVAGSFGFTSPSRYGARRPDGTVIDSDLAPSGDGPFPQSNAYGRVGLRRFDEWAAAAGLPFADFGGYVPATLRDTSVFDFYNKLMDGPNKGEWTDWDVFDVGLTQTFFGDRLGYHLTAFKQNLDGGQWAALGWQNRIMIDVNTHNLDGTANPNLGRAFIEEELRDTNATRASDRTAWRAQLFAQHDFARKSSGFLARLLGEHRFTGALSQENQQRDDRRIKGWNLDMPSMRPFTDQAFLEGGGINTAFRYYLSGDLRGRASAAGANVSNIASPFVMGRGGNLQIRYFDNTWTAPASVNPGDPWQSPDPNDTSTGRLRQASNPANYRGWTTRDVNVVTFFTPGTVHGVSARDYLTSSGQLSEFNVDSLTGVWQGYFWNRAIIGTYGYRKDKARSYRYETSFRAGNPRSDTRAADLDPARYHYSNPTGTVVELETTTRNWSVAAHVNRLLAGSDFLPANVSLYYNRGENFAPLAGRIDAFRRPLPPPAGETEEYSALLTTKDQRYALRATRFETRMTSASSTGSIGNMWALEQTLGFTANMMRDFRSGRVAWSSYSSNPDDVARLQTVIAPAWFQFEADLKARFPDYVNAWMGPATPFATDNNGPVTASAPAGFSYTEDSISKGWEFELIANPLSNWRLTLNASRTKAIRDQVPGTAFRSVATFVDEKYMTTNVGLAPVWWHQNTFGGRSIGPYASFRPDWLRLSALNGQLQPEVRKWRANFVTSYDFTSGRLRDVGVGGAYRWEDRSIIGYAPMRGADGTSGVNLNAPFYGPTNDAVDLWLSYRRKLTDRIAWRIQLHVYNAFGKNKLVPVSASVDPDGARALGTITPTSVIPLRASAFTIREGRSWALSNTLEF